MTGRGLYILHTPEYPIDSTHDVNGINGDINCNINNHNTFNNDSGVPPPLESKEEPALIHIKRRVYSQEALEEEYEDVKTHKTICDFFRKECKFSPKCVGRSILGCLPVVKTIRKYNFRQNLVADIVAGLSLGCFHLPQGLGYGLLSTLTPSVGLYTGFFAVIAYVFFGTSPHGSMGTCGVVAVLISNAVERESLKMQAANVSRTFNATEIMEYKIGVSTATCLVCGLILLGMGFLKLGFITNFLSKSFIGGFTFAAGFHIVTSQIPKLLHIKVKNSPGWGGIPMIWGGIFTNLTQTIIADMVIGLISMAVLLAVKIGINQKFAHKLPVPIPIDLIVVIISTAISHFAELKQKYGIAIVNNVPTGIPAPTVPDISNLQSVAIDGFIIAVYSFALNISLCKMTAKIHNNVVYDNQELVAYGASNILGAFFQTFPSALSPPRSMLLSNLGAKSTLNGIWSAAFLLIVLLVAGPLFESLPIAMLAAMIIVAMKDLLLQVLQLKDLWKINKPDFFIWIATALVSILADLDLGLMVGVVFSMVTILAINQLAKGKLMGTAESEDIVMDSRRKGIRIIPGVRIFRFESPLYYASVDRFKKQLFKRVLDPIRKTPAPIMISFTDSKPLDDESSIDTTTPTENGGTAENGNGPRLSVPRLSVPRLSVPTISERVRVNEQRQDRIHHVILDCSTMSYIDVAGIDCLALVISQYGRIGVTVFLAAFPSATLKTLYNASFFSGTVSKDIVFHTVLDAYQKTQADPEPTTTLTIP